MKTIFTKDLLPLIDQAVHHRDDADSAYSLYLKMRCEEGLDRLIASEVMLLTHAAERGDSRAMIELARHYFYDYGTDHIPYALSWWRRAILTGIPLARDEFLLQREEIHRRAREYTEGRSPFTDIVMRCAMLAEYHLFDLGLCDWGAISNDERLARARTLIAECAPILGIRAPSLEFVPGLTFKNSQGEDQIAYGLAHPCGRIDMNLDLMHDREWFILVLFHELGHFVCFAAMGNGEEAMALRRTYGLSDDRVAGWSRGDLGRGMTTFEEDPDTLSHSTYTNWAVLFADPKP